MELKKRTYGREEGNTKKRSLTTRRRKRRGFKM